LVKIKNPENLSPPGIFDLKGRLISVQLFELLENVFLRHRSEFGVFAVFQSFEKLGTASMLLTFGEGSSVLLLLEVDHELHDIEHFGQGGTLSRVALGDKALLTECLEGTIDRLGGVVEAEPGAAGERHREQIFGRDRPPSTRETHPGGQSDEQQVLLGHWMFSLEHDVEGTALAVLGETAMMLEREIMDASYQASTRYQALAQGAKMSLWEGSQQASALKTQAIGGLIKGAATVGYDFAQAKGMFPSKVAPTNSPT